MGQPIYLGVNIDHVATLRQARFTRYPDPVEAMFAAERGGADGITIHLREDQRHIQPRDVTLIQSMLNSRLNLEMAVTDNMLAFALEVCPPHVCLVPERREELTTEGGLDVVTHLSKIEHAVFHLSRNETEVSLFIDPVNEQIEAAAASGARVIEIHTGEYASAKTVAIAKKELERIQKAARFAAELGLTVNAGHGLHYHNVQAIAAIPQMNELNIGHSIISRAVFTGLEQAVREMKQIMCEARGR